MFATILFQGLFSLKCPWRVRDVFKDEVCIPRLHSKRRRNLLVDRNPTALLTFRRLTAATGGPELLLEMVALLVLASVFVSRHRFLVLLSERLERSLDH